MRLPQPTATYTTFVRYGLYVVRRLRRAGKDSLAVGVEKVTRSARTLGRAWEDADDAIQAALADRDAVDDELDEATQTARNTLAGRGTRADREEPYTLIFADGIGYYIAAPLDESARRYGELKRRLEENLPASDPARRAAVAAITRGLKDFEAANKALDEAQSEEHIAGTRARNALRALERQLEKTYGALMTEHGKAFAERFFPKVRTARGDVPSPRPPAAPASSS
jgi:hypothetical protein